MRRAGAHTSGGLGGARTLCLGRAGSGAAPSAAGGAAFSILSRCSHAMERGRVPVLSPVLSGQCSLNDILNVNFLEVAFKMKMQRPERAGRESGSHTHTLYKLVDVAHSSRPVRVLAGWGR